MKMLPCNSCGTPTPAIADVAYCSRCDMCQCGLSRAEHGGLDGHGAAPNVKCEQFTWAGFRK